MEYALEADPGQLTASFPTYASYDEARSAANQPCMYRKGIPPIRVLVRATDGAWSPADTEGMAA